MHYSLLISLLNLLVDSAQQLVLSIFADVELFAEFFDNFLRNLTFVNSKKLNVLSSVEFNLKHANWLFFELVINWWQSVARSLRFDLWIT
jgi:hypothetical protein